MLFIFVVAFALCYINEPKEVAGNVLEQDTDSETPFVPLRRLIKEIKEGLVKDGLTDLPSGTHLEIPFLFFFFFCCVFKCAFVHSSSRSLRQRCVVCTCVGVLCSQKSCRRYRLPNATVVNLLK